MRLVNHSRFSLRYGVQSVEELVADAARDGVGALALTDINSTSAGWDFVAAAERHGVRPVLGIDFREGARERYVGIARDAEGYAELCAHLTDHLHAHRAVGAVAPAFRRAAVVYPWRVWADGAVQELGEDAWIGVRPGELGELRILEGDAARRGRVPWDRLVAYAPGTFRGKRDWNCHRLLRAIGENELLARLSPADTGLPGDRVMRPDEIRAAFAERPEWVERADALLAGCQIARPRPEPGRRHNNPHTYTGEVEEDRALIRSLCAEGLAYRYPAGHGEAVEVRLAHELEVIESQGFLAYFLINWDIVHYARGKGYFHVGRGSGANSLVAYLLRITDVDPIELDLYFERFMNLYRTNPPDFDIDFSWTDRDDVTRYIFERFPHVALVGAYSTFQHRAVVRELGKVFGLPKHDIDALAEGRFDLATAGELETLVLTYAARLHDFPNSLTPHACGILIADRPLHHFCATFLPPKGFPTTQFDMVVAEDVGLFKFDILSQRGLGKIRDTVDLVARRDPAAAATLDLHDLNRFKDDPAVRSMLREARAIGCFYVESPAMRMLLRKLSVDTYLGLVAASSVIRPGVSRSGMMRAYIERHRDPARRADAHPVLADLMPETYGVMVYQEDVIKVAHRFAGLDLGEADVLRRGMSGKFRSREEFGRARDAFIARAIALGHAPDDVADVWRQVESFAGYAFAKGHSASYAVESYQSLFLKAHYPIEYMAACINNFGGFYRTEFYVHEARRVGATVVEPCIARGEWEATVHGTTLVLGFNLVAGADAATVRRAVRSRAADGPFRSLEDFVRRVPVGPEQLLPLVRSGGFAFTGRSKQQLLWEAHLLLGHVRGRGGAPTLFAATARPFTLPPLEGGTLEDAFDQLELLGFPLAPPFHLLTAEARSVVERGVPAGELAAWVGRDVEVIGYVVALKDTATVRGERMCFGCFIDAAGDWLDTVHFPPVLRSHPFRGRGIYRIRGTVREEFDCLHVEASVLEKLPYIPDPRFDDSGTPDPTAQPRPTVPRRRSAPNGRSATASWKRERPGT